MPPSCRVNVPMKTNIRIIITQSRNTPGAAEVVINTCIVPLRRRSSAASSDHPRGSLPGRQHAPSSHSNVAPARTWLAFHAWAQGTAKNSQSATCTAKRRRLGFVEPYSFGRVDLFPGRLNAVVDLQPAVTGVHRCGCIERQNQRQGKFRFKF